MSYRTHRRSPFKALAATSGALSAAMPAAATFRGSAAAAPSVTWNSARKSGDITLSNGDLDAHKTDAAAAFDAVIAAYGRSSGVYYFEIETITMPGTSDNLLSGLADGTTLDAATLNTFPGNFAISLGLRGDFASQNGGLFTVIGNGSTSSETPGTRLGWMVDWPTGSIFMRNTVGWAGGGTPVAGVTTGRQASFTGSPTLYPAASLALQNAKVRLHLTAATITGPIPSGASAWAP